MLHPFFFFNDTATTEIYTLSLHDALPIYDIVRKLPEGSQVQLELSGDGQQTTIKAGRSRFSLQTLDRKSTRLNSSHLVISYAVFCLKKKIPDPSTLDLAGEVTCRFCSRTL